jgi:hypothetical protein
MAIRTDETTAAPKDFKIQGSNDEGVTWTDIDTRTGVTWTAGETKLFFIPSPGATTWKMLRVYVTATQAAGWPAISELTFYDAGSLPTGGRKGYWGIAQVLGAGAAPTTYPDAVLGLSPIAYYRFSDADGATSLVDSTSNARNLPMTSGTFLGSSSTPSAVGAGRSWVSAGGDRLAGIGAPPWWSPLAAFSISVWFKVSGSGNQALVGSDQIIQAPGSGGRKMAFYLNSGPLVFMRFTTAGGYPFAQTPLSYNDGNWHHAVVTSAAVPGTNAQKIYVDKVMVAQVSSSGTWSGTSANLTLAYLESGYLLSGGLDEVAIFDRELGQSEVDTLNTGTP